MFNIETASIKDLVGEYNRLQPRVGGKCIRTFKDRPTAVKRVSALHERLGIKPANQVKTETPAEPQIGEPTSSNPVPPVQAKNFLGFRTNLVPDEQIRDVTKRCTSLFLLKEVLERPEGASFEDMKPIYKQIEKAKKNANVQDLRGRMRDALRSFHFVFGYGVVFSEDGKRVRIIKTKGETCA